MGKRIMALLVLALVTGVLTPMGSPREIVVTSTADSGPETLQEFFLRVPKHDVIAFDSAVGHLDNTTASLDMTDGASDLMPLQLSNDLPMIKIETKRSPELEDNRIGPTLPQYAHDDWGGARWIIDTVTELGAKRNRTSFDVWCWEDALEGGFYSQDTITPAQKWMVSGLAANGVKLIFTLLYWDESILDDIRREGRNYSRFRTEEEIQEYIEYVRMILHHIRDYVDYYEIWNEPDGGGCPWEPAEMKGHFVRREDYIRLAKRVIPVIREEDPNAKIVVGATTNLVYDEGFCSPRNYFFSLLRSDLMPLVDAISWHGMYGASPAYDFYRDYYYDYPSIVEEIKRTAEAHGFQGEYISEEMCWRTSRNPNPGEPWTYTEDVAAKYYARAIVMHLGMDVTATYGGELVESMVLVMDAVRNLCTTMAGAKPEGFPVAVQVDAERIAHYGFSLPNGDKLFAIWTDGVAVDNDPGIPATLVFPRLSARKVTGIDVLNGFEQELITETEDGNLVIGNLLVKDYPIILRLTGVERAAPSQSRILDANEYRLIYDADGTFLRLENVIEPRNAVGVMVTVKATVNGQEQIINHIIDIVDGKGTKDIRLGSLFDDIKVQEVKIEY